MTNAGGDASSNTHYAERISDFRKNIVYSVNISAQTNGKIFQKIRREKLYQSNAN